MVFVLIHWYVVAGQEEELFDFWEKHAPPSDTPGFIGETPCKLDDQDEPGVTQFINVARWSSRQHFEYFYRPEPGPKQDFEVRLRERVYVTPVD